MALVSTARFALVDLVSVVVEHQQFDLASTHRGEEWEMTERRTDGKPTRLGAVLDEAHFERIRAVPSPVMLNEDFARLPQLVCMGIGLRRRASPTLRNAFGPSSPRKPPQASPANIRNVIPGKENRDNVS